MKSYIGYIRVSTAKQGEHGSSLQEQRSAIEAYAQRQGLIVCQWIEERETAAKQGRHQFNQMLAKLARGSAFGVIIHKIDRSARNLRDWARLGDLIDRGVGVPCRNLGGGPRSVGQMGRPFERGQEISDRGDH